jgi:hypothetical protein
VVQRSAGLVVYCLPWGLVQVVVPWVASDFPAGCVFADVVAFAGRVQIVGGGGPVRERDHMIKVADPGGAVAGGEGAGPVPGDHQLR